MLVLDQINKSLPKAGTVKFVAIDGHGGSGKSTLAEFLAKKLDAEIIHVDNFAGYENKNNWWLLVVKQVFEPIKQGVNKLSYQPSKWWESHNPEPVVDQRVSKVMILEGVGSLRKEFRPYISVGLYVDTPKETCLQRGFERDKGQDGKPDKEIKQMWQDWYEIEEKYIKRDKPEQYANIIVYGTVPFKDQHFIK